MSGTRDDRVSLALTPEHEEQLFDLFSKFVIEGEPHMTTPLRGVPGNLQVASSILNGIELFIVGHEYGHCLHGHLERGTVISLPDPSCEQIMLNWEDEYEADRIGWMLATTALEQDDAPSALCYAGTEAVFHIIEAADNVRALLKDGTEYTYTSQSHPPPQKRVEALRKLVSGRLIVSGKSKEEVTAMFAIADAIKFMFEMWYSRARHRFVTLHEAGVRPFRGF